MHYKRVNDTLYIRNKRYFGYWKQTLSLLKTTTVPSSSSSTTTATLTASVTTSTSATATATTTSATATTSHHSLQHFRSSYFKSHLTDDVIFTFSKKDSEK